MRNNVKLYKLHLDAEASAEAAAASAASRSRAFPAANTMILYADASIRCGERCEGGGRREGRGGKGPAPPPPHLMRRPCCRHRQNHAELWGLPFPFLARDFPPPSPSPAPCAPPSSSLPSDSHSPPAHLAVN